MSRTPCAILAKEDSQDPIVKQLTLTNLCNSQTNLLLRWKRNSQATCARGGPAHMTRQRPWKVIDGFYRLENSSTPHPTTFFTFTLVYRYQLTIVQNQHQISPDAISMRREAFNSVSSHSSSASLLKVIPAPVPKWSWSSAQKIRIATESSALVP